MSNSLSQTVSVSHSFQRATRLDCDFASASLEFVDHYVVNSSARNTLEMMGEHIINSDQRAFTWTGPYGSGKSSLALMFCSILRGGELRKVALNRLALPESSSAFKVFASGEPWKIFPITGRQGRLADDLAKALGCKATDSAIEEKFRNIVTQQPDNSGVLIVVDELGKYLEADYASENSYLLQELAETASRTRRKCALVGILHQAFDAYASRFPKDLRVEWEKVKGRFIDIPLLEGTDEMVGLLSAAIRTTKGRETLPEGFFSLVQSISKDLVQRKKFDKQELENALVSCWPLNPLVALLIGPISRRSFAQNERSVYSFLCSREPHGFLEFLDGHDEEALYSPADYWNYLKVNFDVSIMATSDAHRWMMACDAVERSCEKGSEQHVALMKTLSLIYLFRTDSGIEATLATLSAGMGFSEERTKKLLSDLVQWKCAIERRFQNAWGVFAGSDFDVQSAVAAAMNIQEGINASLISSLVPLPPVVARAHYLKTGTLRWFEKAVVPIENLERYFSRKSNNDGMAGSFLLVLPKEGESRSTNEILEGVGADCQKLAKTDSIAVVGIPKDALNLRRLLSELQAVYTVATSPEVEGDETARHEIKHRAEQLEAILSEKLMSSFSSASWLVDGSVRTATSQTSLALFANDIVDSVFGSALIIKNELINRDHLSGNLVSARRTLMSSMFLREHDKNLGYEGFPPDYALYLSILKSAHVKRADGKYQFAVPKAESRFWKATMEWLESQERVTVQDIYSYWRRPPFGLKYGPMPLLALFLYLVNRDRIALYENGVFIPEFSEKILDEWLASPNRIGFFVVKGDKKNRELVHALSKKLSQFTEVSIEATPLGVARAIVQIVITSPKWSQRSSSFSQLTQKFKQAALKASDPMDFLFREIPDVFGEVDVEKLAGDVEMALKEYLSAMPEVIERMKRLILASVKASDGDYEEINKRAVAVHGLTGKLILEAFTSRLETFTGSKAEIEGFIGLACSKPPFQWSDSDIKTAETKLSALGFEFRQLEATASLRGRPVSRRVFKIVAGGSDADIDEVIDLTREEERHATDLAREICSKLKGHNRTVALAALAEAGVALADKIGGAS